MDDEVIRQILERLEKLERKKAHVRYGTVIATSPLTIKLGAADTDYPDVRKLNVTLAIGDHVAVLVRGNDLLVLGKVV